jgi:hypothetical protein
MGPKDSFNGALTWLLHYGDKEPLAAYIKENGIQKGVEADALSQLLKNATFRLGHTTRYEADVELDELKSELRQMEGLRSMRPNSEIEADIRKRLRESGVRVPSGWIKEYMAQFEPRTQAGVIDRLLAEKPRLRKGSRAYRAEFERLKKRLSRIK